jgi:hypothetical protein
VSFLGRGEVRGATETMGFAAGEAGTVCWNHAKSSTSSTAKVYSINPNCPFIEQYSISMRLQRKPHNNI